MEIKPLSMSDQMRMIRGVDNIMPKPNEPVSNDGTTTSFADFLKGQLANANQVGVDSEKAIERSITGQEPNPHSTLLAIQRAEISFQLLMSVKQRLEQAYQQIIRTPIG